MEYGLYKILRTKIKIPYFLRVFFGFFCIAFSFLPLILPLFPGSFVVGLFILMAGIIFIIHARKLKHTVKLRKSIVYLCKNIHSKVIIKRKVRDIKRHVRHILKAHV